WRDPVLVTFTRSASVLAAVPAWQVAWSDYGLRFYWLAAWSLVAHACLVAGAFLPGLDARRRAARALTGVVLFELLAIGTAGLTFNVGVLGVVAVGLAQLGFGPRAARATLAGLTAVFVLQGWTGGLPGLAGMDRAGAAEHGPVLRSVFIYVAAIGGTALGLRTLMDRLREAAMTTRELAEATRRESERARVMARHVERVHADERARLVAQLYADLGTRLHALRVGAANVSASDAKTRAAEVAVLERTADVLCENMRTVSRQLAS
ncbi:MAG: hypothetical protein ACLGHP_09790, partial [Vicinamibacteria bacterium]